MCIFRARMIPRHGSLCYSECNERYNFTARFPHHETLHVTSQCALPDQVAAVDSRNHARATTLAIFPCNFVHSHEFYNDCYRTSR
jgi:hypothetical protein